jgi:magnesium chelatase subunit D
VVTVESTDSASPASVAADRAAMALALVAIDPIGLGGMVVRAGDARVTQAMVALLADLLRADDDDESDPPVRRIPLGVSDDRLLGGIDLAGTLAAGRVVRERGILAAADGGVVVLPSAERATAGVVSALIGALDAGEVVVERDGVATRDAARIVLVACDDHHDDERGMSAALTDRLAMFIEGQLLARLPAIDTAAVRDARRRRDAVQIDDESIAVLTATAAACGVPGIRAPLLATRAARASAALAGRHQVDTDDITLAAGLVLAPRATRVPTSAPEEAEAPPEPPPPDPSNASADPPPPDQQENAELDDRPLEDVVKEATLAAIPPDLLAALLARAGSAVQQAGRVGEETVSLLRGRPRGTRRGDPRGGARLHVIETLRAAAPWQRVRGRGSLADGARVEIRRDDFRLRRYVERTGTTVIFLVDASGSSAIARLGEAKGAIELLLAESYARRDRVSLLAFRGTTAEELLPPTRALARARRVLAALPGGGGTPLATAIDRGAVAALAARRAGTAPVLVFLTDARANIARDGSPGRPQAQADARQSATQLRALGVSTLFIDTSPRPDAFAREIGAAMGARYVPLPSADARAMAALVRGAADVAG